MTAFTQSYSQPDDYHFCQDSVIAPKLIAEDLRSNKATPRTALDVCAGCGVMGIELLHSLGPERAIKNFDFLEIQNEFEPHFAKNLEAAKIQGIETSWINENYSVLKTRVYDERYDLIIANPPYFYKGEGTASPTELNTRARFFVDSDLTTLLASLQNALAPRGRAYVLIKTGKEHGRDAFTSARVQLFDCQVDRLANVRGTDLIRILKD